MIYHRIYRRIYTETPTSNIPTKYKQFAEMDPRDQYGHSGLRLGESGAPALSSISRLNAIQNMQLNSENTGPAPFPAALIAKKTYFIETYVFARNKTLAEDCRFSGNSKASIYTYI